MHLVAAIFAAVFSATPMLQGQDGDFRAPPAPIPHLRATARSAGEFAPPGWTVEAQKSGDLNADGRPDLVFVLHQNDSHLVIKVHVPDLPYHVDEIDTNPRILAVAFANPDGTYKLAAQNSTLIERWADPIEDDVFSEEDGLTIQRGGFSVKVSNIPACECRGYDESTFTFRYGHGRFELIGFDSDEVNSGAATDASTSVNFLTGLEVVSASGWAPDSRVQERRRRLPRKPLLSLDQVGDGIEFFPNAENLWFSVDR